MFQWCLVAVEGIDSRTFGEPVNIYNLVVVKAIQIGRNAGLEETLGYFQSALNLYEISHFLLKVTQEIIQKKTFIGEERGSLEFGDWGEIFQTNFPSQTAKMEENLRIDNKGKKSLNYAKNILHS